MRRRINAELLEEMTLIKPSLESENKMLLVVKKDEISMQTSATKD
jgi:hypothetical protein